MPSTQHRTYELIIDYMPETKMIHLAQNLGTDAESEIEIPQEQIEHVISAIKQLCEGA